MRRLGLALLSALLAGPASAGLDPPEWTEPVAPFRIAGDIYYVGTKGLGAYLIKTPGGLILLDGPMEENVPAVERSITALGFRVADIKWLIVSHAHFDHAGGLAALKRDSGAAMLAPERERPALESGRPPSETSYGLITFAPVKVDRVVQDGAALNLGGLTLTPLVTPGHTPGCTSWVTTTVERGRMLRVVFPCSLTVAGNRLIGNAGYPGIVADFRASFPRVAALSADIVLPAHPELADVHGRHARQVAGDADAFVDPALLAAYVARAEAAFDAELARQRAATR